MQLQGTIVEFTLMEVYVHGDWNDVFMQNLGCMVVRCMRERVARVTNRQQTCSTRHYCTARRNKPNQTTANTTPHHTTPHNVISPRHAKLYA